MKEKKKWIMFSDYLMATNKLAGDLSKEFLTRIEKDGREKVVNEIIEKLNYLFKKIDLFVADVKNNSEEERVQLTSFAKIFLQKKEELLTENNRFLLSIICAQISVMAHCFDNIY